MFKNEEKLSYHSSLSSKVNEKEKEENKKSNKNNFKNKSNKPKKIVIINKRVKKKEEINNKYLKSLEGKNRKKIFKNRLNWNNTEEEEKTKKKEKDDSSIINKGLLKIQKPIIINEFPKEKHACFLGNNSKKSNNKIIKIYIFHREEIFKIEINNGLTINELIEQILQNIKILKNELELLLIYDNSDIKTSLHKNRSLKFFFRNLTNTKNIENVNKNKISYNDLNYLNEYYKNENNNFKKKILIFPDNENKYKNIKIKDLLKDKINYFIKANQVSKNKYNSYNYKNEIQNLSINSFINNVNKEIEKNNIKLAKNNFKTVNLENNYQGIENLGINNKFKNIVIVEGINLISNFFFNEIQNYFEENKIKEKYDFQCVGVKKYHFGFEKKETAYKFFMFVNNLKLVKSKYFHMKCILKLFDIKNNLNYNNINNSHIKKNFYFSNILVNNNDYFALKNNLNGRSNSYFLINGQKKYLSNDNDVNSMDEIIMMNKHKFKNNNNLNYINSDNIFTIPLV